MWLFNPLFTKLPCLESHLIEIILVILYIYDKIFIQYWLNFSKNVPFTQFYVHVIFSSIWKKSAFKSRYGLSSYFTHHITSVRWILKFICARSFHNLYSTTDMTFSCIYLSGTFIYLLLGKLCNKEKSILAFRHSFICLSFINPFGRKNT